MLKTKGGRIVGTQMAEVLTVTIPEAGKMLGVSRNTAYAAARAGQIPTVKLAGRLVVPKAALMKMLENAGQKPREVEAA